jgi:hypothetical protein
MMYELMQGAHQGIADNIKAGAEEWLSGGSSGGKKSSNAGDKKKDGCNKGDPRVYKGPSEQKDAMAVAIVIAAQLAGKFSSSISSAEVSAFGKYWYGNGSAMNLSARTFNNVISAGRRGSELTAITFTDGAKGYKGSIGFYGNANYDYMLGNATIYYDSNKTVVGFYDFYNFNSANRGGLAEAATRAVATQGKRFGANPYHIKYGKQDKNQCK